MRVPTLKETGTGLLLGVAIEATVMPPTVAHVYAADQLLCDGGIFDAERDTFAANDQLNCNLDSNTLIECGMSKLTDPVEGITTEVKGLVAGAQAAWECFQD